MAGFSSKDKSGNRSIHMAMISGIASISAKTPTTLTLLYGCLEIKQRFFGKEPFTLSYDQITNAGMVSSEEIIETDKSVVGRAAVGGLLLGSLGAVVGGMSGTGKKQKIERHIYFVINYASSSSGEPQVLEFQDIASNLPGMVKAFIAELREKANIPESKPEAVSHVL